MIEPGHAEQLVARVVAGQFDAHTNAWLRAGFSAWARAGGTVDLDRCLRLARTPDQRRRRQRDALLREVARQLGGGQAAPLARRIAEAWARFAAEIWPAWCDDPAPPDGAAELNKLLFALTRTNDGNPLSAQHVAAILRGKFGP